MSTNEDPGERVDVRLKRTIRSGRMPKELLICGPAGTGKTYPLATIFHILCSDYPGLRVLFLRATRVSLTQSVLVTFEQEVLPADGCEYLAHGAGRANRQSYRYRNGSEIALAGLDRNPTRVLSTPWDVVWVNEATEVSQEVWETLSSRLDRPGRDPRFGWLVGDTNPSAPTHHLKQRGDAGQLELWTTTHEANPLMHDGRDWTATGRRTLDRLDRLTGLRYQRLRLGRWVGAEGVVYDEWDPAVHVLDRMPDGWQGWRKVRSIDFGYTNPFVCQWWAIDGDGRAYLYRELYGTRRLVSDWATDIERHSRGETYEATVADHDAEDRATLRASGIHTMPARKEVRPGIEAVQSRLRLEGDGKPRLYVLRSARVPGPDAALAEQHRPTSTLDEFTRYLWLPARDGRAPKDEPLKQDDHGMDAMRYAVAYVDPHVPPVPGPAEIERERQREAEDLRRTQDAWHTVDNPAFW